MLASFYLARARMNRGGDEGMRLLRLARLHTLYFILGPGVECGVEMDGSRRHATPAPRRFLFFK